MKFSSSDVSSITAKPSIIEDIDFQCNTTATSFPVADKLRGVNKALNEVAQMILEAQSEGDFDDSNYTDFPISTTDLTTSQQDYSLPTNLLKIQRLEIKYSTNGTWYKVNPFDLGEYTDASDTTTVAQNFSETKPYYDVRANSMFLYPIPDEDVTGGLKIWYLRDVDEFTKSDTVQEPGFHEAFHPLVSYKPALEYLTSRGLMVAKQQWLMGQIGMLEARLKVHYGTKNEDRHLTMKASNQNYN